jgi:hypothetical protein
MANWCNVRLLVAGRREDVVYFARHARLHPPEVFAPDMLEGEGGALTSDRARRAGAGSLRKTYRFQVRNDDGRAHFRRVSRRFPKLSIVLTYFDPASGDCGSDLICHGKSRHFSVSQKRVEAIMAQHGVLDEPDDDWRYWQASLAAMDLAEARWEPLISLTARSSLLRRAILRGGSQRE